MIWLCYSLDISDPNWTVAQSLVWYQDQILNIYCWVPIPMQHNFTQHGHQGALIWPNFGNLPNTPHILKLKIVLWKIFFIVQRTILLSDFVGDHPRTIFTLRDNFVPKDTKWLGYATYWTFFTQIELLHKALSDIRTKFLIYISTWASEQLDLTEQYFYIVIPIVFVTL